MDIPLSSTQLQQRGIETAAQRLNWCNARNGWGYPVLDTNGCIIGKRWKAYDSNADPKYRWIQRLEGTNSKGFYHVGVGLFDAIQQANGILHFVNGEPAVLTLLAAGFENTLCVFGEGAYPDGIAETLIIWRASKVVYYADKDEKGESSAAKLVELLANSGISVECRSMLDTMPAKSDVNDLWQLVEFNVDAFGLALAALPIFTPNLQFKAKPAKSLKAIPTNPDDKRSEFVESEVIPALNRVGIGRGKKHGHCINPAHSGGDLHPSARIGEKGAYICTCGSHSMKTVAGWLGLNFKEWVQAKYPKDRKRRNESSKSSKANPETLELGEVATLAPFTPDRIFSSRYVSYAPPAILDADCLALKSFTGGGKTQWAAATTKDAPSLLVVSFRQALVHSQADAYGAMAYDALDGWDSDLVASADRVSTTIDSLNRFYERPYDTLVIDEWVSFIGHFSSAGTLKEKAAGTWALLKWHITKARRVIVMDAHLTDDSLAELKALRGDVIFVENTYVQPKVPTQMLPNRAAFFSMALMRIEVATLPVLLGITTPAEARLTKDLIKEHYPNKRVRVITSKQSHLIETQLFIRYINTQLSEVDVLIYNGTMSTGVSMDLNVDSILCLIGRPLSAADGVQMLGRARNPNMRYAYVPSTVPGLRRDAAEIYQSLELAAHLTQAEPTKPVRSLGRLHARHEARRNAEMTNFLPSFRAYSHADGSDTQAVTVKRDKPLEAEIKAIRKGHKAQKKADTLDTTRVPTITPEMLDTIHKEGLEEITPEIDAGVLRNKIEDATAQPVNNDLYEQYHSKEARTALYRADISSSSSAGEIDQRENIKNLPMHQRSNATGLNALRYEGLQILGVKEFDELPAKINGVPAEAFTAFSIWAVKNEPRFIALLGYRAGHDGDLTNGVKAA